MNKHAIKAWGAILALAALPLIGFSLEVEDAHTAGCLPKASVADPSAVCASCHTDSKTRWANNWARPCTPYCMSCHKKEDMARHHTVGTELDTSTPDTIHLDSKKRVICTTCHDLSQPRYDSVRWKATSLFDRMFHDEPRYKTYFLSQRNDKGQLCLVCH